MSIAHAIRRKVPELDPSQLDVIGHLEGPLQVIAGPGAGKTKTIVWRPVNLLTQGVCGPEELVLCAFGKPAAGEMRTRFQAAARSVGYQGDPGRVRISTIHSLCRQILSRHPRRVGLRSDYDLLNQRAQREFMDERFDLIFGPDRNGLADFGWHRSDRILDRAARCFDLITEEDISPRRLIDSGNAFHSALGRCYRRYEKALLKQNAADFSHLLLWACDILQDGHGADDIGAGIRHLMVDEYQDVSYLQELILTRLSEYHHNLMVVGDDDQSIFRFRGAAPDSLFAFRDRFPDCRTVTLNVNYRSHPGIVSVCNRLIAGDGRAHHGGAQPARYDKMMKAHDPGAHSDYPSVISVMGYDATDEAEQLADLLRFLLRGRVISDYSQAALLLHSVRDRVSAPYRDAFDAAGIPVHRAAGFADDPGGSDQRPDRRGSRFRQGRVHITTMHQSKGLEWPVVLVGSLGFSAKNDGLDHALRRYSRRRRYEPEHGIAVADRRRQFYVACTRGQNLLVFATNEETPPLPMFDAIWQDIPRWAFMDPTVLAKQSFGPVQEETSPASAQPRVIDRLEHLVLRRRNH